MPGHVNVPFPALHAHCTSHATRVTACVRVGHEAHPARRRARDAAPVMPYASRIPHAARPLAHCKGTDTDWSLASSSSLQYLARSRAAVLAMVLPFCCTLNLHSLARKPWPDCCS